jgi:serine acetyltransferase
MSIIKKIVQCINRGLPIKLALFCDVDICCIPIGTKIFHPIGIVINGSTKIGKACLIWQNVTIANGKDEKPSVIGNNVNIYANAIVLGSHIGNNAVIGAGSIVLADVPDNTVVVGIWKGENPTAL